MDAGRCATRWWRWASHHSGSDLSVATATTHVGFNIGRINGRLLDLELSALEQNSSWILSPVRVCWPHIFSLPALNRGAKFHIRFPAGKVARRRWNLKRPSRDGGHAHGVTKGRIRLKLHISQNVPGQVLQQADGEVLAIDKQEIETQVEVKSGETLALGGIFTRKINRVRIAYRCLATFPGSGNYFVMTEKKMNDAS